MIMHSHRAHLHKQAQPAASAVVVVDADYNLPRRHALHAPILDADAPAGHRRYLVVGERLNVDVICRALRAHVCDLHYHRHLPRARTLSSAHAGTHVSTRTKHKRGVCLPCASTSRRPKPSVHTCIWLCPCSSLGSAAGATCSRTQVQPCCCGRRCRPGRRCSAPGRAQHPRTSLQSTACAPHKQVRSPPPT